MGSKAKTIKCAFCGGKVTLTRTTRQSDMGLDRKVRVIGALGGTRHTSARRYSHDDPEAVVIAVSEDGPVTVFRRGDVVGHSPDIG